MGQTIISAIGVYISTSIDYLVILIILFASYHRINKNGIFGGNIRHRLTCRGANLVCPYVVNFVPEEWMVGCLV